MSRPLRTAIACLSLACLCCVPSWAAIHAYNKEYFYTVGDAYIFRGGREGLYASTQEAMDKWGYWDYIGPGISNGQSEIKLAQLEFSRPADVASKYGVDEGVTGLVQAVLFEVKDRALVGYQAADGYKYCCTKELVPKTKCHVDRLIYQSNNNWPVVRDIYFENNDTIAQPWDEVISVEKTGMYYLWFVICNTDLSSATVEGATIWKNPTGYLPGMMLPNVKFFATLSLLYISLGIAWAGSYVRFWKDVSTLQHCATVVVALGMMEMSTWYFDYVNFNATGTRPYLTTLYAVTVGCLRKTVSRVLVLIISMGYGVVVPYLGAVQHKIIALGGSYFVAVSALDIISNVGTIDDLTSLARMLLVLPVAALDGIFILGVFTSLSRTLNQLQARRASSKLELYRRFTNTLAIMVWLSVAWIAYEMYYKVTDQYNERWQVEWIASDFWHVLNFAFLCVVCWLFRPSQQAARYALELEGPEEEYEQVETGHLKGSVKGRASGDGDEPAKLD